MRVRRAFLATAAVALGLLAQAGPAAAITKTVNFDDRSPGDRITTEYQSSAGVTFQSGHLEPEVKATAQAHSTPNVAVLNHCIGTTDECGEFFSPQTTAQFQDDASAVSVYVGYLNDAPGDTATVELRAYAFGGAQVGTTQSAVVTSGGAFTQLQVTAPSGQLINYIQIIAPAGVDQNKSISIDDLAVTYPGGGTPNFGLSTSGGGVDVLQGQTVDVPIQINRANGSNGNINFTASGLPTGMMATFSPNPVTGTGTTATMHLTATQTAPPTDLRELTVTGTPAGAAVGPGARTVKVFARIRQNCDHDVRFPFVDARSDVCMIKDGHVHSATNAAVRINGLVIKPADDSHPTLQIDDQNKTIKGRELTRPWSVSVDSNPDIPIYVGPIDWDFSGGGNGPHKVLGFSLSGVPVLKGLPIQGIDATFLESGKAQIKPTVKLGFWPFNYFGAITSSVQFTTDNDHGPDFSGLDIKLDKVDVLALELKNVELQWGGDDTWSGAATVVLNFGKKYEVGAAFGIKNGDFDHLNASVGGLNIDIGLGLFLQRIGFGVQRNPLTLAGTIGVTAGPQIGDTAALSIDGTLKAVLADPWLVEVDGAAKVLKRWQIANAYLRYISTGIVEFGGSADFSWSILSMHGAIAGWVESYDKFNVDGSLKGCIDLPGPFDPCADAKAVISSKGLGGCIGVYGYYVGVGAVWGLPPEFDAFTGCDLSPFTENKAAVRVAANSTRFTIPRGLSKVAWELRGANGIPPGATLAGPHGEKVTVSQAHPNVHTSQFLAQLRANGTTFILVNKPSAGAWTITGDGSSTILGIREARGLPPAKASATVSGKGHNRVLHWHVRQIKGQRVTFAEYGKNVRHAIVTTTAKSGSAKFHPADGKGGKRTIVALVEQNGIPRVNLTAGSYRAPGPLRPGKPEHLKIKRRGSKLVISWTPHPAGFRHAVYVKLGNRKALQEVLAAKKRSLTVKGVPKSVGAKVTVLDLTDANGKGPAAKASIKRVKKKHKKK